MKTRAQGTETRKRLARFAVIAWTPASAPRAPEAPPMTSTRQQLASSIAAMRGTAPARPPVGVSLAAAAAMLRGGAR